MNYALPYIYYFISVFFGIFSSKTGKDFVKLTRILFIFVTIYFIGLRGFIEADWLIYYPEWNNAPSLFDGFGEVISFFSKTFYEKGFVLLLIICKTISNNYLFLQFVILLFTLYCLDNFLTTFCHNYYYLGACLFYLFGGYMLSIILIRNCISVMLFLLSVPSLINKNWKKYFFTNLIGLLFHTSSIFYFPLYFILRKKYNTLVIFTLWIFGNVVFLLQIPIASTFFSSIAGLLFGNLGRIVMNYLNSKQYNAAYGISMGFLERTVTFLLFFINRRKFNSKSDVVFINMLYLYSFIFLWCTDFRIVVDRLPILIYCCYWVLYSRIYGLFEKRTKAIFLTILIMYSIIKIIMFFGTPIGYYENICTGAMTYEERKVFTYGVRSNE